MFMRRRTEKYLPQKFDSTPWFTQKIFIYYCMESVRCDVQWERLRMFLVASRFGRRQPNICGLEKYQKRWFPGQISFHMFTDRFFVALTGLFAPRFNKHRCVSYDPQKRRSSAQAIHNPKCRRHQIQTSVIISANPGTEKNIHKTITK